MISGRHACFALLVWLGNIQMQNCMKHWRNGTERGKQKYLEKKLSQYHFVNQKSYMDRAGTDSGVPRNFVRGGVQQIQLRTERTGAGGGSPLVRGSGGSCNLVQEILFHIVKFS